MEKCVCSLPFPFSKTTRTMLLAMLAGRVNVPVQSQGACRTHMPLDELKDGWAVEGLGPGVVVDPADGVVVDPADGALDGSAVVEDGSAMTVTANFWPAWQWPLTWHAK